MSENFSIVSFAVALAVNLLLFGVLAAFGVAAAFRLEQAVSPRVRYLIAVAVFLIAAFVPFAVTLRSVYKPQPTSTATVEPKQTFKVNFQVDAVESERLSSQAVLTDATTKEQSAALDSFVFYAGNSELAKGFFALWLSVAVLLLFREFISHLLLERVRKRLRPADVSLRKNLFCPDDMQLYISESESPATVGLFRPVVILPARFPDNVSRAAMRSILQHETAHALWRDPLVNALLRIVRAIFWVSPALWFIECVVRDEREAAADYAALTKFSNPPSATGAAAVEYATSLLTIAKFSTQLSRQKRLGAAMHFGGSSRLENRVRRLLAGYAKPTSARLSLALFVILFSFLGMTLLPVASQQLNPGQRLLAENIMNDIPQTNNFTFVEQNSFADFEKRIEGDEREKGEANLFIVAADKSKTGKSGDAVVGKISISAQPTPPVNSDDKSNKVFRENEQNKPKDKAILPVPASVKPTVIVPPVPVTPPVPATVKTAAVVLPVPAREAVKPQTQQLKR